MLSPSRRVVENVFGMLSQKFQTYQRTLKSMPENADNIIFVTYNMYCYLRDQSVDLGDMGSSANYQSILKIILKQGGNAH